MPEMKDVTGPVKLTNLLIPNLPIWNAAIETQWAEALCHGDPEAIPAQQHWLDYIEAMDRWHARAMALAAQPDPLVTALVLHTNPLHTDPLMLTPPQAAALATDVTLFELRSRQAAALAAYQAAVWQWYVKKLTTASCENCGEPFEIRKLGQRFCSIKCGSRARSRKYYGRKKNSHAKVAIR
jgi:hypothetical protein